MAPSRFDDIGYWSELKLEIIKKYAAAYSTILSRQRDLYHLYVDAFAGGGVHISRSTGEFVAGSPLNALLIEPRFREYHLIDIDRDKITSLRELVGDRSDVYIYEGDCNPILLHEVFPRIRYEDFRRALCLLDPYGLHLAWDVIRTAGQLRTIDMFLNFPVADMNRNVLWRDLEGVDPGNVERMNRFWGDDSWRSIAYTTSGNLFGWPEKAANETIAEGFRERLKGVANFKHVPEPLPMRNSQGAIVYYLFFASQSATADHIIRDIFGRYRERGA